MPTKFSQFIGGGNIVPGDIVVGLRNGINTQFNAPALPNVAWQILIAGGPLVINNGYILQNAGPANFSLPAVAAVGQILELVHVNGNAATITQGVGQQINVGNVATTLGVGGTLTSNVIGDSIILICTVANTIFFSLGGPQGNWVAV
jgi:hypothetical protein